MNSFERAVDYAEYLVELSKQNPAALLTSPVSTSSKGKSIQQKLLELYIEETGKQCDDKKLQCNTHLLRKLVRREKLNCLILNLYPGNEGYSLMLRSKTGVETETVKLPYEVTELLDYVDDSELPPLLVDVLEKAQVNVFYSGCVVLEIRDFRRATNGTFDMQYVLLKPNAQTLFSDINNLTNDGNVWTQEDLFSLESKLLLATEEPLCLDPSPAVVLVANRQQYDRKKLNTPLLKRAVRKYSQAAANRKRKFAASSAPPELKLHDFIMKKKERKAAVAAKLSKPCVDYWKQKQVPLTAPESVDVEKFAKLIERGEKNALRDNTLNLIEEQVLERDGMQDKKLLAKLTIYHRTGDDAYIGELYLDHDYVEEKSKGATCRFLLGNKESVRKYLEQFREIFTEEGRRAVKITTNRPGQAPIVTCTQTTPTSVAMATVNQTGAKSIVTTAQTGELSQGAALSLGTLKRPMPIQLSLSLAPAVAASQSGQVGQQVQQTVGAQQPNQIQLNMQPASVNQSALSTQRLPQQQASQSPSASQRLKQLGIHTSIASRNSTPTNSPVTSQPPIAQLFGSPPSVGGAAQMLPMQPSRTPSHTPTPPPNIVSPPPQNPGLGARKPSLTSESSTIHHMAQTTHQANVSSYVQGETTSASSTSSSGLGHQTQGVANINITGIPPNINIQNLTGLPGMNIANLQGLQGIPNVQVSLSVPGGSIAVPISLNTNQTMLQNQGGVTVSISAPSSQGGITSMMSMNPGQTSLVSMATQQHQPQLTTVTPISTSHVSHVTGVLTQQGPMLSVPINLGPQLTGVKSGGQIRASSSVPLQLQFGQQGIQFVNLQQQRAPLKPGGSLGPNQALGQLGVKPSVSVQGPLTTTLLPQSNLGSGQQVLSHIPVGKSNAPAGSITTTLTHPQLVQIPPQFQAQLQPFKNPQHPTGQPLQFHQILRHSVPTQQNVAFGGKPKPKKRTTPTPPK